ncbi:MAG: OsmC family protein [Pseudomonadota bacterium]
MTTDSSFTIELRQQADYRFAAHFDNPAVPPLVTDEPAPLGRDEGPNPSRLLAVAVANCLSASLLFAMRKFHNEPGPLRTQATAQMVRNEQKRLRVGRIAVDLHLGVPAAALQQLQRVLDQFEEFCVVTQSVRAAIPVDLRVFDGDGRLLKGEAGAQAA